MKSAKSYAHGGGQTQQGGKRHGGTLRPVAQSKVAHGGGKTQQGGKRHGKISC